MKPEERDLGYISNDICLEKAQKRRWWLTWAEMFRCCQTVVKNYIADIVVISLFSAGLFTGFASRSCCIDLKRSCNIIHRPITPEILKFTHANLSTALFSFFLTVELQPSHHNNRSRRPPPHTHREREKIQVARSGKPLRAFSLLLMRLFNGLLWAPERLPRRGFCISPAWWRLPENNTDK